ncbi:phytanoyl-CoA dioxygenase family protein [Kiloniella majae]|uniref:phytanoyl-CoA dioxygenase family protein n=1 Tax=Kiloniella majae TaxID=1938558 RepID=UPI000A2798A5|nr:phytanoyl-CoA dioxygenase family protein [Kiloniella majae]
MLNKTNYSPDYARDGVQYFENIIPDHLISELLCEVIALCGRKVDNSKNLFLQAEEALFGYLNNNSKSGYLALLRAIKASVRVKQISITPSVISKAQKLLNSNHISQRSDPVLHITGKKFQLSDRSLAAPWHQDWPALRTSKHTLVVWVPLGGAKGKGALSFKVGSHQNGVINSGDVDTVYSIDNEEVSDFDTLFQGMPEGDAAFFNSLTVHSSQDIDEFRMAISFRFEDLTCPEWRKRQFTTSQSIVIDKRALTDEEKDLFHK